MSYKARLTFAFAVLFAIGFAGLLTNIISIHFIKTEYERNHGAHHLLTDYLNLANHAHEFFKHLAVASESDGFVLSTDASRLQTKMRGDLALLKEGDGITAPVRAAKGDEEELAQLALLEKKLFDITRRYHEAVTLSRTDDVELARSRLRSIFDENMDRDFSEFISRAITQNHDKVVSAETEMDALIKFIESISYLQILFTVPLILLLCIHLLQRLGKALSSLLDGTDALAQGKLDYRIQPLPDSEFNRLGQSFNHMASQLVSHRKALENANQNLEHEVIKRTDELRSVNARLEKADRSRRRFFADISHELRTPLTIIRGEAEVSLRGADKTADTYKMSLKRIVAKCGDLGRLVDDLLFIARSQAGKSPSDLKTIALNSLLTDVLEDFRPALEKKNLTLAADMGACDGFTVLGDAGRLRQVFSILMDNAVRYSQADGHLSAIAARADGEAVITVENSGPGIPEDDLEHVFERFYRGGNVPGEGTGLGLPVARAIVEAHGGSIALANRSEGGVAATVRLPLQKEQARRDEAAAH